MVSFSFPWNIWVVWFLPCRQKKVRESCECMAPRLPPRGLPSPASTALHGEPLKRLHEISGFFGGISAVLNQISRNLRSEARWLPLPKRLRSRGRREEYKMQVVQVWHVWDGVVVNTLLSTKTFWTFSTSVKVHTLLGKKSTLPTAVPMDVSFSGHHALLLSNRTDFQTWGVSVVTKLNFHWSSNVLSKYLTKFMIFHWRKGNCFMLRWLLVCSLKDTSLLEEGQFPTQFIKTWCRRMLGVYHCLS